MEKNLEKPKFVDSPEYRHHYMALILKQVQDLTPVFQENYIKSQMKHYGIDQRHLPPDFRVQRKEAAGADASRIERTSV